MSLLDPPREAVPTRAELRRLLEALLAGDSDLNGFVYDYYPGVLSSFHPGLGRVAKLDLLLDHAEPSDLVRRLRECGLQGRRRRAGEVFDWTIERQRHSELFGRQPVMDALDEALKRGGWVVVSGSPGVGKTSLLVHLLNQLEQRRGRPVPHHFLRRTIADSSRPGVVLRSLAAQIEAQYPHQTDADAPPELRLIQLLSRVAHQGLAAGDDLVLVVDGLDEAEPQGRSNPLPRFLPPELPPGVTLVCSIDPRYPHFDWLMDHAEQQLGGHIDLNGKLGRASTTHACEALFTYHAPRLGLSGNQIAQLTIASDGSLLCATKLLELVEGRGGDSLRQSWPGHRERAAQGDHPGNPQLDAFLANLPVGLEALLRRQWQSLSNEAKALLGLLCAARQPLPLALIDELLGFERREAAIHLRQARLFVTFEPAPPATSISGDCVHFAHALLKELVEETVGATMVFQNQRQLGAALCTWPPIEDSLYGYRRLYALRHAITQHIESDAVTHASQIVANVEYLVAKCQENGSAALAEDLEHAAACTTMPESARTFSDLAQALRIGAHWLAHDPGALPGLLYNLLLCASWSPASIERVLNFPQHRLRFHLAFPLQRRDTSAHTFAGHWDSVVACELTSDSKRLVSVGLDHTVRLWDLNSGALLMHFYGHAGSPTAFAVTLDGHALLYATSDHSLALHDLSSGAQLRRLRGHTAAITTCTAHPDGRRMLTGARDHKLKLWDLQSGEELLTLHGHSAAINASVITRDGKHAVSGSWDHSVRVWDLQTGAQTKELLGHTGAISALWLLSDDQHVVSASWDHSLQLWDIVTGALQQVFKGHSAPVNACLVTRDGKLLISASDDRTLKIWDLQSGHELRTLMGHMAAVKSCALGPGGRTVLSASEDLTVRQWDIATGAALRVFAGHLGPVLACAVTRDGHQMISASEDKTLKLWDLSSSQEANRADGHGDAITACFMSISGAHAVTASEDQTLKLWDLQTGSVSRTLIGHTDAVSACAPSPDGRRIVSASPDGTVVVWDLASGTEVLRFNTSASPSRSGISQPSGGHLAIPSDDHMIELWGMPLDSPRRAEGSAMLRVRSCVVTLDNRHLVTAAGDRLLRLWDLGTGAELLRFSGHTGSVNACVLHPDGKRLISASSDRLLILWDLSTGAELLRFSGHTGSVNTCAISSDGKRLISGSVDKTLRLWDLSTGAELSRLTGHAAPISACLITADGRRAISAGLDYTLKLWELTSGMCFETIYGSSPFLCLDSRGDWVCAGDQVGNVWLLRDLSNALPSTDARIPRQSLMESVRKFMARSSR